MKHSKRSLQRKVKSITSLALTGVCILSNIPANVYASSMDGPANGQQYLDRAISSFGGSSRSDINIDILSKQKVDLILTKGTTDIDLSTFKEDIINALKQHSIDVSNLNIQTIETSTVDSNGFDASEVFNNWGRAGATGKWYLSTVIDKQGINKNVIVNSENTQGFTGFYDPNAFDSSKIVFEFDSNSTNSDDDVMGAMIKFNVNSGSSNESKKVTTYMLVTHRGDSGGYDGISPQDANGLFKVTNGVFYNPSNINVGKYNYFPENIKPLALNSKLAWVRDSGTKHFKRYRLVTEGNNIKVYQQEWNNNRIIRDWELMIDYTDTDNPIMSGSYGVFACSQPYTQFTNITAQLSNEKTFEQSLLETTWRDDAHHVIVNVDDEINSSFTDSKQYSEVLSRAVNDKIHLIQWGSSTNKQVMSDFIRDNGGMGVFLDSDSYSDLLNSTVEYIKSILEKQGQSQDIVVVGENEVIVSPDNISSGTSNEDYPDGMWRVIHDPEYYDNPTGTYENNGVYTDGIDVSFNLPGKYDIYYGNEFVKTVYANRLPVASFTSNIQSDNMIELISNSYDLDVNSSDGIIEEEWSYKKIGDTEFTYGKPSKLDTDSNYLIRLRVQDQQGYWSSYYTQYITTTTSKTKPVASFNFLSSIISKYSTASLIDSSYDPGDNQITKYTWHVYKNNSVIYNNTYSSFSVPDINFSQHGAGEYEYELIVENDLGLKSSPFTRTLKVYEDTAAPLVIINNNNRWLNSSDANISMSDTGSGLKRYRVCVSESEDKPSSEDYSEWKSLDGDKAEVSSEYNLFDGYIHIEVEDNAGNIRYTSQRLRVDSSNPSIIGHVAYVDNTEFTGLTNKDINIVIDYDDGESGFARMEYKVNGKMHITYSNKIYISETFSDPIEVVLYDIAGNASEKYLISDIQLDNVKPEIEVTGYKSLTNEDSVVLSVIASDNMSDKIKCEYSIISSNSEQEETGTFENSYDIQLTEEGTHNIIIKAVDDAGNTTEYNKIIVIDRTIPEILNVSIEKQEFGRLIHISAIDGLSGIKNITYDVNDGQGSQVYDAEKGIALDEKFTGEIQFIVEDNAGNITEYSISDLEFDEISPEISVSNHIGWSNKPIDIIVNASDDRLIKSISWETNEEDNVQHGHKNLMPGLDGGLGGEVSSKLEYKIPMINDGEYDLTVTVSDTSGNDTSVTRHLKIDKKAPEVSILNVSSLYDSSEIEESKDGVYIDASGIRLDLEATDSLSGINRIEYKMVPDNSQENLIRSSKMQSEGNKDIFALDVSSHIETFGTTIEDKDKVIGDKDKVEKSITKYGLNDYNNWIPAFNNVINITHELSGKVLIRAIDNAGNISKETELFVCIDRTSPDIHVFGNEDGWGNKDSVIEFSIEDKDDCNVAVGIDIDKDGSIDYTYDFIAKPEENHNVSFEDLGISDDISGEVDIIVKAVDKAGNESEITVPILVESNKNLVAPTVNTNGYEPGTSSISDVLISAFIPEDKIPISGINHFEYSIDKGSTWKSGFLSIENGAGFNGEVIFRGVTNAGNITPSSDPVKVIVAGMATLYFNTDKGKDISPIIVAIGDTVEELPTTTCTGYRFGGWYTDDKLTNKVETPLTVYGDMELYSKWVKIKNDNDNDSGYGTPLEPLNPSEGNGSSESNSSGSESNNNSGNSNTEGSGTEGTGTENTEGSGTSGTEGTGTGGTGTENTEGTGTENNEGSGTSGTENSNTEGSNTEGSNTEGSEGSNTENSNTEGSEGSNTENSENSNTEGSNTEGSNTEGSNTEGSKNSEDGSSGVRPESNSEANDTDANGSIPKTGVNNGGLLGCIAGAVMLITGAWIKVFKKGKHYR